MDALNSIDTKFMGVLKRVKFISRWHIGRRAKGRGRFEQAWMNAFYIGYFDGDIKFRDGEVTGRFTEPPSKIYDLEGNVTLDRSTHTEDVFFMFREFRRYVVPKEVYHCK